MNEEPTQFYADGKWDSCDSHMAPMPAGVQMWRWPDGRMLCDWCKKKYDQKYWLRKTDDQAHATSKAHADDKVNKRIAKRPKVKKRRN